MPSLNQTQLNYAFQKVEQINVTSENEWNGLMTRRWRDGKPSEEDGGRAECGGVERIAVGCGVRVRKE